MNSNIIKLWRQSHKDEAIFSFLFEEMYKLSYVHMKAGDPFSYARSREIHMANTLGHKVAPTLSGADAYEDEAMTIPVEYKSTTQSSLKATYNGISVKNTWEEQMDYLKQEKICKYKRHYFSRYENGKIKEIWCMDCEKVLEGLISKLKRQFDTANRGADPRLGASLSKNYIISNSIKIYPNNTSEITSETTSLNQ
jgi:hypothetical protein